MNRKLLRRLAIAAGVVAVLAVAAIVWSTSGNQATISQVPTTTTTKRGPTSKEYTGAYMHFTYPSVYFANKLAAKDNDLELAMLSADTTYPKQLAVAVSKLDGNGLDNNSTHQLRQSQPQNYTRSTVTVDGGTAEQWRRVDGTEITVLIPHGSMVASLSFTATGSLDDLQPEVTKVLESYHWN